MNCLLLPKNTPLVLSADSPKLAHIKNVINAKEGDEIFAGNIGEPLKICTVHYDVNGGATLTPIRTALTPNSLRATLAVAYARPQIAQRILFEAACFGVRNLIFYPASKGEADYAKSSLYAKGEYFDWLVKGAEQACASDIPDFQLADSLQDALQKIDAHLPTDSVKTAPDLYEATAELFDIASAAPTQYKHFAILMGSERGFTNAERHTLRAANYTLVSLGKRVLRTDTAIISALSIITAATDKTL